MMKLRILLLNLLVVYTIHFMAQESYSNDVTCVKADDNIAVITASGTAEKKKEATTAFSQKETSKEPIFLHAEEKTMPQGGGSPVLAMLLLELLSAKKE